MFLHTHPYEPFLFEEATKLIVGTLPPPRFTTGELKNGDVDFCYGSIDGQLWRILDQIFELGLKWENTDAAVQQRVEFLKSRKIGICDIVDSAERYRMDASDLGMQNVKLRDLIAYLEKLPNVDTLLFTGGNSKNGPEYFFRRQLKARGIRLETVSDEVPRIHQFHMPGSGYPIGQPPARKGAGLSGTGDSGTGPVGRIVRTVSLIAPSGAANRAVGSLKAYKTLKEKDPAFTTVDFRALQYSAFF